jgi:hypothetical protein
MQSSRNRSGPLRRRDFLAFSARLGSVVLLTEARALTALADSDTKLIPAATNGTPPDLIPAPEDPALWSAWREELTRWRVAARHRLKYRDALYCRAEFAWAQRCFSCCFVLLCDETFYDAKRGRYTVEGFLDHGAREFGGYDALVLWHAYPRIGFDDRNQFDFYRDMPGGLDGVRDVSRICHRRGVRVFVDYNPWDSGTRREGEADLDALARLVKAIEADGIFLDTMSKGAAGFRAKLDAARRGVVLEGEGALPLANIHDHHLSWAQWFPDSRAPGVLRNKWFERRHLQHQIKRWERDRTGELHTAWMNGSGMMVWENVFGSWVGWSARDHSILRAMLPIQRRYARLFCGERWTPLVPTLHPDVFASLWEGDGVRLWTLVNRSERAVEGDLIATNLTGGEEVFDLLAGCRVAPLNSRGSRREEAHLAAPESQRLLASAAASGTSAPFRGHIPPRGIGAFVAGKPAALGKEFPKFLAEQSKLNCRADFDKTSPPRHTTLAAVRPTKKFTSDFLPAGMAALTPPGEVTMKVEFRVRECGFYDSQTEKALTFPGLHRPLVLERQVKLAPYAIDLTPVTNAQFAQFLKATRFRPRHAENFLKHWQNGAPPPSRGEHPVVYVSLDDARAYAAWAGKRLPTEEEWQFAAAGTEQRRYPWGDALRAGACNDGSTGGTTPVTPFPEGRSPFGCFDLCGNVWHWTESERSDGRTRFCILKGGSFYKARGSD